MPDITPEAQLARIEAAIEGIEQARATGGTADTAHRDLVDAIFADIPQAAERIRQDEDLTRRAAAAIESSPHKEEMAMHSPASAFLLDYLLTLTGSGTRLTPAVADIPDEPGGLPSAVPAGVFDYSPDDVADDIRALASALLKIDAEARARQKPINPEERFEVLEANMSAVEIAGTLIGYLDFDTSDLELQFAEEAVLAKAFGMALRDAAQLLGLPPELGSLRDAQHPGRERLLEIVERQEVKVVLSSELSSAPDTRAGADQPAQREGEERGDSPDDDDGPHRGGSERPDPPPKVGSPHGAALPAEPETVVRTDGGAPEPQEGAQRSDDPDTGEPARDTYAQLFHAREVALPVASSSRTRTGHSARRLNARAALPVAALHQVHPGAQGRPGRRHKIALSSPLPATSSDVTQTTADQAPRADQPRAQDAPVAASPSQPSPVSAEPVTLSQARETLAVATR